MAMLRWTFSISTVASSTRMPTARAIPPSVMVLSEWPSAHRTMIDVRIDSGIEVATISVLRHEPRNSRIIRAVSPAAIAPSLSTPVDGRPDEDRLVEQQLHLQFRRQLGLDRGQGCAHALDHAQGRGPLALEDGHEHRPAAVAADDVGLHREAVRHVGHVLDVDRDAVDRLDSGCR